MTPPPPPPLPPQTPNLVSPIKGLHFRPEDKLQFSVLLGTGLLWQLGFGMIMPILPSYAQSLGLCDTDVGLIIAVPSFARAVLNLPMGRLVDVVGRKGPMVVGAVIDAAGCFATAAAGGLHSMVVNTRMNAHFLFTI